MITALTAQTVFPVLFFYTTFQSQAFRLWSGLGDITFDSVNWVGNGWLTGIKGGEEANDLSAQSITVELSGIPEQVIALILNANQGAPGDVYMGALSSAGALVASPYKIFSGKMDTATIKESADGSYVDITYETRLVDLDRAKEYRYSPEGQKIFYPFDRGFDYVVAANKINLFWGNKKKVNNRREKKKKQKKKNTR